jgi:hypothetical protein
MRVANVDFEITESLGECEAELEFVVGLIWRFTIPEAGSEMFESKLKTAGPDGISIKGVAAFREVATFQSGVNVELKGFMRVGTLEGLLGFRLMGACLKGAKREDDV